MKYLLLYIVCLRNELWYTVYCCVKYLSVARTLCFFLLLVMVDLIIFFVAKFNTSFSGELHSACAKEQVSVN